MHGLEHGLNPFLEALLGLHHRLTINTRSRFAWNLTQILPHPIPCDVMRQRGKPELSFLPSSRCYSFESRCHDWLIFSLHRRPYPPFGWSSCLPRTIQLPLAASPCGRLSRPQSTISQSDFRQTIRSSSRCWLVGPYPARAGNLPDLPCSHEILWPHAVGTNPGSTPEHSPSTHPGILPSPLRDKVGYSNHDRFRGYLSRSLSFRPTASLSTLRSIRYRTPRKTRYLAAG